MTVVLVAVAAVIVLRKDATVKILDMVVPVMAVCYFAITILIIVMNLGSLPGVFARICPAYRVCSHVFLRKHLDSDRQQPAVLAQS